MNNAKLAYAYQYEEDNIVNYYKAQYSFVFVEYTDSISDDTYKVNAGIKIAFDNLFDISTWRMPSSIKPHLSELNRFENIVLNKNMNLQTTRGVEKTQAAIDRDSLPDTPANHAPTWTASSYDTGLTIRDDNDDPKTIKDLTAVSSDAEGDALSYSIVSISTQSVNDDTPWSNSLYIENGVLKAYNLVINDPNYNGIISVIVKVSDGTNSSNTTVNFDFLNYQ
jgi:hypothetical protein